LRKADAITLLGGAVAGASIVIAVLGMPLLALRLLILSYLADVFDGWVARRYDAPDPRGQQLDRSLDRVTQIIAPLIVYIVYFHSMFSLLDKILYAFYAGIIIPAGYYRLVYRRVSSLRYFPGLPLFVHAITLIGAVIADLRLPGALMILLALGSSIPIPYFRSGRGSGSPSPMLVPRAALLIILSLLPYGNSLVELLAEILVVGVLAYGLFGWIPAVWMGYKEAPSGRDGTVTK
jgi:phosphatidylserine synthase